jgi:hypothetical protein
MKTSLFIRSLLLSIAVIAAISSTPTFANWYGGEWKQEINGVNNCNSDGEYDSVSPTALSGDPFPGTFGVTYTANSGQNRIEQVFGPNPIYFWCQYWDSTTPSVTAINYTNGWTNNTSISLSTVGSDYGGAGNYKYSYYWQYSDDSPNFGNNWSGWAAIPGWWQGANITFTDPSRSWQNRAYRFGAYALDLAGNQSPTFFASPNIYRLDTTPPTIASAGFGTPVSNYLATTNQNFTLNYTETTGTVGSPLAAWSWNFTNYIGTGGVPISGVWVGTTLSFAANIRNAATNLDYANGSRLYTARVTNLCDTAGNCSSVSPWASVGFNVFANPNFTPNLWKVSTNLDDSNNIADGTPKSIIYSAIDGYNNPIIPAPGINRTLRHHFSYTNSMYLNQHSRSGDSSIFASTAGWVAKFQVPISGAGGGSLYPITSISNALAGQYAVNIHAYTPTANSYASGAFISDPSAEFAISGGRLEVIDPQFTTTSITNTNNQPTIFGTPFVSSFSAGDLAWGQIIEGTVQSSTHRVTARTARSYAGYGVYFGFSGTNLQFFGGWNLADTQTRPITTLTPFVWPSSAGDNQLWTRLQQNAGTTVDASNPAAVSTHIGYSFDGYPATINTHILGRSSYFSTAITNVATQVWLKVIGLTASDNANINQLIDQFPRDINLITGIRKSDTRNTIRKSVSTGIRGLRTAPVGSTILASNLSASILPIWTELNGARLQKQNQDIYYFTKGSQGILELYNSNASNTLTITGQKTIVAEGVNIYIRSNIAYANLASGLALVALKNANGEGGKIYIDPAVTNIASFLYADGAVLGYDGVDELSQTTSVSVLKNQLYIYGSVIAANTIGWSAAATPICPAYYADATCTREIAQKFDLNYLRRYFLIDANTVWWTAGILVPNGWAKIIGGGVCNNLTGNCTSVSGLASKFTNTTQDLAKYPLIIEYDPNILKNPPPLISILQ